MKIKNLVTILIVVFSINNGISQEKKFAIHTIAFYNLENLFDTINDPMTIDEEFLEHFTKDET